jgi:hypothetical protein
MHGAKLKILLYLSTMKVMMMMMMIMIMITGVISKLHSNNKLFNLDQYVSHFRLDLRILRQFLFMD